MSILFGIWNFDRNAPKPELLMQLRRIVEAKVTDGTTLFVDKGVAMLYGAVHTNAESRKERQPVVLASGNLLLWDGRLDNRSDLSRVSNNISDSQLVADVWEEQGSRCLRRLLGDWALAVFNPREQTLVLARDFLGARPLYYVRGSSWVAWSSLLEPLLTLCPKNLNPCEEYLAGWLSGFPEAHLTPYAEIHAVPPSSFVTLRHQATKVERYWDFNPRPVRYSSDSEYEEAFRHHFSRSVRLRLRADARIVAELSGGMDSSAIVCVADQISARDEFAPVETVSFFDDSEPNWNERPFFAAIEAQRGRVGFHLNVASDGRLVPDRDGCLPPTPVHGAQPSDAQRRLSEFLSSGSYRILLSGIGGDEFTGGVPTGVPELADLLRQARVHSFLVRAYEWALSARKPIVQVIATTARTFLPALRSSSQTRWPMPWLRPAFLRRHRTCFKNLDSRFRLGARLPSFQENVRALEEIRRQISCTELNSMSCEKRYPFLDRELLEFLFNIPREQLVRPGERRSLFRRALHGIVPSEVLGRRRKAYAGTSHLKAIASDWERVQDLATNMKLESLGVLSSAAVRECLDQARRGDDIGLLPVLRVLRLEWWLRDPHINALFIEPPQRTTTGVPFASPQPAPTSSQPG